MLNKMKTYTMYVKTVITSEHGKILLLKQKRADKKQRWDLPGATFTEEQSFDETVITNVQKEIGYYVYPGKIVGIADYSNHSEKQVHVIMEGTILNGELLLSKEYETYTWVPLERIKDYPLVPWLHTYVNSTKNPFQDVESEIEELTNLRQRRREIIHDDFITSVNSGNNTEKLNGGVKSSFSLLKETIKKTFHPKAVQVTQTTPKTNEIYQEPENTEEKSSIMNKLNFRRKNESDEYIDENLLKNSDNDIIVEHDDVDNEASTDIIVEHDLHEENREIIKSHEVNEVKAQESTENIREKNREAFDLNVKDKKQIIPEIKVFHKDEKTPLIRREKESNRVSFNSENLSVWKERLNKINRTEANNRKKTPPRPKGKRKE